MPSRISTFPVLVVTFIGTLGFSIVLPFLVFLVVRLGGNAIVYGLIGATYPAAQVLGAPLLGRWSDRVGRKRVLLVSQAGTLASWLLFAVALALPVTQLVSVRSAVLGEFELTLPLVVLFVARALDGLTGGNISVANAYLADITAEADRGRAFGRMGMASNLGFVFGPALASLLGVFAAGEWLPVLAASLISLAATVLIAAYLPESRQGVPVDAAREPCNVRKVFGHEQRDCLEAERAGCATLADLWRMPRMPRILAIYFLVFLGFNLFYTAFPMRAAQTLGWTVKETGLFFAVLSAMMVVVQGPVLARLTRVHSDVALVVAGGVILAGNFLLLLVDRTGWTYLAAVFFALGNGIMWPSILSLLSRIAGERYQGAAQGVAGSAGSLASVAGLLAGGVAFQAVGSLTFVGSAALILLAVGLALPGAWHTPRTPVPGSLPRGL